MNGAKTRASEGDLDSVPSKGPSLLDSVCMPSSRGMVGENIKVPGAGHALPVFHRDLGSQEHLGPLEQGEQVTH